MRRPGCGRGRPTTTACASAWAGRSCGTCWCRRTTLAARCGLPALLLPTAGRPGAWGLALPWLQLCPTPRPRLRSHTIAAPCAPLPPAVHIRALPGAPALHPGTPSCWRLLGAATCIQTSLPAFIAATPHCLAPLAVAHSHTLTPALAHPPQTAWQLLDPSGLIIARHEFARKVRRPGAGRAPHPLGRTSWVCSTPGPRTRPAQRAPLHRRRRRPQVNSARPEGVFWVPEKTPCMGVGLRSVFDQVGAGGQGQAGPEGRGPACAEQQAGQSRH